MKSYQLQYLKTSCKNMLLEELKKNKECCLNTLLEGKLSNLIYDVSSFIVADKDSDYKFLAIADEVYYYKSDLLTLGDCDTLYLAVLEVLREILSNHLWDYYAEYISPLLVQYEYNQSTRHELFEKIKELK